MSVRLFVEWKSQSVELDTDEGEEVVEKQHAEDDDRVPVPDINP